MHAPTRHPGPSSEHRTHSRERRQLARKHVASQARAVAPAHSERPPAAPFLDKQALPSRVPIGRYLCQVVAATTLVAVCPILVVWWLRTSGAVTDAPLGMAIAIALSLGASYVGAAFWETRSSSGDVLFGELMLWGFLRRLRNERRLASAVEVVGSMNQAQRRLADGLTAASQATALERLSSAMEATDPHTHGHSRRVARHSWMIARRLGLDRETVARIRTAAALHDVGKIETPPAILRKRGPLSDEEFAVIQRHPVDGARMVEALGDARLAVVVRHHHERLDGTGYPDRLSGEDIPIGSRIIAVADTFDAITSARPYRPARSHKKAIDILKYEAGIQLDPAVVRAFCSLYSGRRPLALWATLTSLPAQLFSWIGGGIASVASVAQVAAVSAVAAVGTATVTSPPARPVAGQSAAQRAAAKVGPAGATGVARSTAAAGKPGAQRASRAPRTRGGARNAGGHPSTTSTAPSAAAQSPAGVLSTPAGSPAPGAFGGRQGAAGPSGPARNEEAKGRAPENAVGRAPEGAKGSGPEAAPGGKPEEAKPPKPVEAKPPKAEEAKPPKSGEPKPPKSEEPKPAQSEEAKPPKSDEGKGRSGEAKGGKSEPGGGRN